MTTPYTHAHILHDTKQTPWQLASIQLTGFTSLPILATSILVLKDTNFKSAILTLLLGNILLFFIRLGIITMSHHGRKSSLDISRDYLGYIGSYFIAFILLASTLAWYIAQTTLASNALTSLIQIKENAEINQFVQVSVALGILSTLLCMEGIVALRWLSVISFPILIAAFFLAFLTLPLDISWKGSYSISLAGLGLVLGSNLGITADMPTFFRHSQSLNASLKALILIQIITFCIGIGALFFASVITPWFGLDATNRLPFENTLLKGSLITLIFLSVICTNVSNVYSASVGWEILAPKLAGRKEYLILGLGLTIIFILVANILSMSLLLETTDICLINLSIVLLLSYIIRRFKHHIPHKQEQVTYLIAWLLACLINILQYFNVLFTGLPTLVTGVLTILLVTFLGIGIRQMLRRLHG